MEERSIMSFKATLGKTGRERLEIDTEATLKELSFNLSKY